MAHKVTESERSPAVTSANWKEHILLQKQMQLLGKNERTVSHRISVEQKVLLKRFHWKLRQSKLHHARIKQDKDMERDIRRKSVFTFNTNVGFEDENDESLRKIWSRGKQEIAGRCGADAGTAAACSLFKKWESISISGESDKDETVAKPAVLRPRTAVPVSAPVLQRRPVSAFPLTMKPNPPEKLDLKMQKNAPAIYIQTPGNDHTNESLHSNDDCDDDKDNDDEGDKGERNDERMNSQTAPPRLKPRAKSAHPGTFLNVVIGGDSRPASAMSRKTVPTKSTPTTSIFSTEKKPSLLDLHKERIQSANYEARIRSFGDSLQRLQADQSHLCDYYTMRLVQNSLSRRKSDILSPSTPVSDYKRNVGNVTIRPMTLKALNYDFDPRQNKCMKIIC